MHNAAIGCDGIKSKVREFVAPECAPLFAHKYCHRGVIPMEKVIEVLGEKLAMNNQNYLGNHGHCVLRCASSTASLSPVGFILSLPDISVTNMSLQSPYS
jgi:salicylate hydroxylase